MIAAGRAPSAPDLTDVLQPYLPRLVRYWDEEAPGRLHRQVEGSMALVDISGFTLEDVKLSSLDRGDFDF